MKREVLWSSWDEPGLEHFRLSLNEDGVVADGEIITTIFDGRPTRIRYWLRCDTRWRTRELNVTAQGAEETAVRLRSDGEGHWTKDDDVLPTLDGCIDVDIMATPFTNTLPIRRLDLRQGESADMSMVYVEAPSLNVAVSPQRYTCLESRPDGGLYRYESLDSGYTNELPIDADGIVLDYPGIWRRVYPKTDG